MDKQKIEYARNKVRHTESVMMRALVEYAYEHYKKELLEDAWVFFWDFSEEIPGIEEERLIYEQTFLVWFLFDWVPEESLQQDYDVELPKTTLARHYLENNMRFFTQYQRDFIQTICNSPFSFFVVKDAVPGESITLYDILSERDVVVREVSASRTAQKGHIIYTKVVFFNEIYFMLGCSSIVFPTSNYETILQTREQIQEKRARGVLSSAVLEYEIRTLFVDCFYASKIPITQRLANTDGDLLIPCELFFDWSGSVEDAFKKLKTMAGPLQDDMPNEEKYSKDGTLSSVDLVWAKEGNNMHLGWDNTTLGYIKINNGKIKISVNSLERAEKAKKLIQALLGSKVQFKRMKRENLEKKLRELPSQKFDLNQNRNLMNQLEVQKALKKMNEKHWQTWPDIPIPMLLGMTPREAAKASHMQERLQMLFLSFENKLPADSMGPDVDELKREIRFVGSQPVSEI